MDRRTFIGSVGGGVLTVSLGAVAQQGRDVDVIVTIGTATVLVAKKATTIPILMAGAGEPLELGLVPSLPLRELDQPTPPRRRVRRQNPQGREAW